MLCFVGVELVEVLVVFYKNFNNYVCYFGCLVVELVKFELNGVIWVNQFDNVVNCQVYVEIIGFEIWEQIGGKVDGFICVVGLGGMLVGVVMVLQFKGVKIGLVDFEGVVLYSFYIEGVFDLFGLFIIEGIGQGCIIVNFEGFIFDFNYCIFDVEVLLVIFDLLEYEGFCFGGLLGINVVGVICMVCDLGFGYMIVMVLCDYGMCYQIKLFNLDFLCVKGLLVLDWMMCKFVVLLEVFED